MTDREILNAILYRLDEISGDMKSTKTDVADLKEGQIRIEMRLDRMDDRLEYLGVKWMEHDEKIIELKQRQTRQKLSNFEKGIE